MYACGIDLANTITLDNHMEPALFQCWHTAYNAGPTFGQRFRITINARCTCCSLQVMFPIQIYTHRGRSIVTLHTFMGKHSTTVPFQVCIAVLASSGQSVLLRSRVRAKRDVT